MVRPEPDVASGPGLFGFQIIFQYAAATCILEVRFPYLKTILPVWYLLLGAFRLNDCQLIYMEKVPTTAWVFKVVWYLWTV
jgi:hypothetical protein